MATDQPRLDPFHPVIRDLYNDYCQSLRDNVTDDEQALAAGRAYNDGFKRPYVSMLMADVVSERWKLGASQKEIAERLGIANDRAWVSRALRAGILSLDVYLRLRFCPFKPPDWEPSGSAVENEMHRAAFIEVAKFLSREELELNELDYELTCQLFMSMKNWVVARARRDESFALDLVKSVCQDPGRTICPDWYTDTRKMETIGRATLLREDASKAFAYLVRLHEQWSRTFVAAHDAIQTLRWSPE